MMLEHWVYCLATFTVGGLVVVWPVVSMYRLVMWSGAEGSWWAPLEWLGWIGVALAVCVFVQVFWEGLLSGMAAWHRDTLGRLIERLILYSCWISTIRRLDEQGRFDDFFVKIISF